jgi:spore coat protein CotH
VGIRFKGNSSLQSSYRSGIDKLSFKLDFDEYENDYPEITDQRFYGFRQLNLKNNFDDRSLVREKVGSDLFREFGLVSPKTAFCVVYVDHGSGPIYYGVYTLVEEVDDTLLDSQFGNSEGNLYKPDGTAASFAANTYNDSQMEKRNNEALADYSDVYALYQCINSSDRSSDPDSWKADVNNCLHVDGFLQWLAANTGMQNWDTYGIMTHNYYLYNNPDNGMLTWVPWDNNEALQDGKQGGALSLSLSEVGSKWPLISYLVDVEEYRQVYEDYLLEFTEGVFSPDRMIALYSQYHELLQEYAYAESAPCTFIFNDSDFDSAIETLKNHVQTRAATIQNYLD